MTLPTYSILISHDAKQPEMLYSTLSSVCRQTYSLFEISVILRKKDRALSKALAQDFPLIKVFISKQNRKIRALNQAGIESKAPLLVFISSGIRLHRNWLKYAYKYLTQYRVDALATPIWTASESARSYDQFLSEWNTWRTGGSRLSIRTPIGVTPLLDFRACVVSSEAFRRLNGFNDALAKWEQDFSLRLYAHGYLLGGNSEAISEQIPGDIVDVWSSLKKTFLDEKAAGKPPFSQSLPSQDFLRNIFFTHSRPPILLFALCHEAARRLGALFPQSKDAQKWKLLPGKNALATSFSYRGEKYFLELGFTFVIIDSFIFLCGTNGSKCLSARAGAAIQKLLSGNSIEEKEKRALLGLKIFRPLARLADSKNIASTKAKTFPEAICAPRKPPQGSDISPRRISRRAPELARRK